MQVSKKKKPFSGDSCKPSAVYESASGWNKALLKYAWDKDEWSMFMF